MTETRRARPLLGAALPLEGLRMHRGWILERQRDLELQDFYAPEVLDGDWQPLAEQIKALLDGHRGRLGLHGPFLGFRLDSEDPEIRAVVARRMDQALDVCAALGVTQMVVHSPYTTWSHNNLDNTPGARERLVERVHLTLRRAVARAEAMGCVLVIENIEDKDPHARVALAASFNSPAVRVSLDTGHAHYAHGSTGAPPVDYYVHAAGDALQHVHLQDADGFADRHWHPGEGTVRWEAVFAALAALTSDPRLILEVREPAGLRKGAAHLEQLGLAE
ncbi:sugar phosphate isomerase/epimerase family protein [Roseomonas sp. E05]|uniref:sugar phosphate isomerase/epimerase family protein n=1 Tax=Roseomonas sp. E05 TaxID=3046310 RepID=UPI0024BA2625|nr:sugar phosphate isomerase/epimerase family protein [Roseomonas sp. E05]MDJ0387565.1 sugar phosphate isomerase/epimerase family protein [Roseomonas sp. E05]